VSDGTGRARRLSVITAKSVALVVLRRCPLSRRARSLAPVLLAFLLLLLSWGYALWVLPMVLRAAQHGLLPDAYPSWNAARVVLRHGNPYSASVTAENQLFMYGILASPTAGLRDEQRFAYPIHGAFLYLPLAVLPWSVASNILRVASVALITLSVLLWMPSLTKRRALIAVMLVLASYPAIHAIQTMQPTILAVALVALASYLADHKHPVWSGLCAALSTFKPQIFITIALPFVAYCLVDWKRRKVLACSFAGFLLAILVANWLVLPNWLPEWITTLRAYSRYAISMPHFFHFSRPVAALMLIVACWKMRHESLMRLVAISITVFQFIIPFQIYNELLLISPVLWLLDPCMGTGVRSDARVVAANIPKILVFGGIAATALCFPVGLISPLLAQETVPLARVAFVINTHILPK